MSRLQRFAHDHRCGITFSSRINRALIATKRDALRMNLRRAAGARGDLMMLYFASIHKYVSCGARAGERAAVHESAIRRLIAVQFVIDKSGSRKPQAALKKPDRVGFFACPLDGLDDYLRPGNEKRGSPILRRGLINLALALDMYIRHICHKYGRKLRLFNSMNYSTRVAWRSARYVNNVIVFRRIKNRRRHLCYLDIVCDVRQS